MLPALLIIALSQTEPEAAPAAETPPPAEPSAAPSGSNNAEAILRKMERISKLPPEEQAEAMSELGKRMPTPAKLNGPPVPIPEVTNYAQLSEAEQARYSAREFFSQLVAGDARAIVSNCAYPFQLEDKRVQSPEELFQEWLRNLRAKRTDLLTLYDLEILTPQEMEKKYGKPPARLSNLPWKAAKTYVAVANLSGHAAVAVLRQHGQGWAVVGYHD